MDKIKYAPRKQRRPSTRRLVQLYSALLYNAHLRGFLEGEIYRGNTKALCVPGFNCYSCPGAVGACPLGALQNALASTGHRAGWYVLGILLLYGVILGRTVCGWLCPLGWLQELLHKIPTPKLRKSRATRALSWLKYAMLGIFVAAVPLWYGLARDMPLPAFCKYICPAGTLEGAVGLLPANPSFFNMLGALFTSKFVIMLVIGLACVFCYRSFCRFLCPLGAIYGMFSRFNIFGVKVDGNRCNQCGACVRHCEMDVRRVGDHECIHCGQCMAACHQGAISLKAGKITLKAPDMDRVGETPRKRRRAGRIAWGIALAALGFALLWYNVLDPGIQKQDAKALDPVLVEARSAPSAAWESDAPVGYEVGQQLQDFTVECFDGAVFHLADCRGKITFINLWATWCTPCVQELPYFNELYQQRADDVAMLAIHSSFITDDPREYLASKGFVLPFTADTEDEALFNIVHGSATLPQTIVLNRKGEVVYNQVGSVTPEVLAALYEKADQ